MAIVLKEKTTLNSLVRKIEKERESIEKEKRRYTEKQKKLDQSVSVLKKKYKKIGKNEFMAKYGKVYAWLAIVATCGFILLVLAHNNAQREVVALWGISMCLVAVISSIAKKSYIKNRLQKTTGIDIDEVIQQEMLLHEIRDEILLRECKNVQNFCEHSAEFSGNAGEQAVIKHVKDCFGDDTFLINDIYITNGKKTTQIDHVLVSPRGIFCIETKNFGCKYYRLNDENWYFKKGKWGLKKVAVNSPQSQSVYHAKMLYTALNRAEAVIIPVVVLANPNGSFRGNTRQCDVIYTKQLLKTVKCYKKIYSIEETREMAKKILRLHAPKNKKTYQK